MTASKILIVEDEAPIREMIVFHLARAGYETLEARIAVLRVNCSSTNGRTSR